jgi:hypothetical protein
MDIASWDNGCFLEMFLRTLYVSWDSGCVLGHLMFLWECFLRQGMFLVSVMWMVSGTVDVSYNECSWDNEGFLREWMFLSTMKVSLNNGYCFLGQWMFLAKMDVSLDNGCFWDKRTKGNPNPNPNLNNRWFF